MSDRLDYNFGARLGASAKEAKDAFLEEVSRAKDEPGQTAQGALKATGFDSALGLPADIGYLVYDLLANPEPRRARMEARKPNLPAPEERFLSSDYIADKFGVGYEDEEQFGRLFALNPFNIASTLTRGLRRAAGLGMGIGKTEDLTDSVLHQTDINGLREILLQKKTRAPLTQLKNVRSDKTPTYILEFDKEKISGSVPDVKSILLDSDSRKTIENIQRGLPQSKFNAKERKAYQSALSNFDFNNLEPVPIKGVTYYRAPLKQEDVPEVSQQGVGALAEEAKNMNKSLNPRFDELKRKEKEEIRRKEKETIDKITQSYQENYDAGIYGEPLAARIGNDVSLYPKESKAGRKLLVVGCCKTKKPDATEYDTYMPAEKRYIGELFKVLKKKGIPKNVDVAILSAKDGLIHPLTLIENYDVRMSPEQKEKLLSNENIVNRIKNTVDGYDEVFVAAGQDYTNFLDDVTGRASYKTYKDIDNKVEGMGDQKRILGDWIKNEKSRFEGIGGLDKTAKNMQEISFTERFKEKTQDVVDRSKKDVLDADLENEAKFRLEVQSGLFPFIDSKSKGMDTEKIKKDVFNTLQKLIDSRVYKDVMGDRYYEPVVDSTNFMEGVKYQVVKEQVPNITKEGELKGYTTVKKPKLKVRFRELKPSTASREAKPATSRFIDLDGLEEVSKDELPATFIRRAQGGGVSSLAHKAKTMNFKEGGGLTEQEFYKERTKRGFDPENVLTSMFSEEKIKQMQEEDEASLEYIKSLRNPELRKYKFNRFLKKTPEERAQIIAQEKLGRTEFLMELMPYLRKDTKPEDIAPGSSQILDDSTLIHTGVGRILGRTNFLQDLQKKFEEAGIKSKLTLSNESDKKSNVQEEGQGYAATRYERSMPRGLSGLASRALPDKKILDTPDDSGFVDFSAIKNLYAGSLYDKMGRIAYPGMVYGVASRATPDLMGHEYRHSLNQDLREGTEKFITLAGHKFRSKDKDLTERRNRLLDFVTARTEDEYLTALYNIFNATSSGTEQKNAEMLLAETKGFYQDPKDQDKLQEARKNVYEQSLVIVNDLLNPRKQGRYANKILNNKKHNEARYGKGSLGAKRASEKEHTRVLKDILENYHHGPYFKNWLNIVKNSGDNLKEDYYGELGPKGDQFVQRLLDKNLKTFLPKPPSAFDELSSQRFMRRN